MKKLTWLLSIFLVFGLISACGNSANDTDGDTTDTTDEVTEADKNEQSDKEDGGKVREYNQQIVDNENIRATLVRVEHIVDETWDEERVEIVFEVENKRSDTIEVQAREVSADGKMIDDMMLVMSQEVAAGKLADAVLKIENYEGDLPAMEDNIEMVLHIFSWDDMDYTEDHPVTIDLKK